VLSPENIAAPIRHVLRRQANTTVLQGTVTGVDVGKKLCFVYGATLPLPYDYLVLATGARHSYFGHDEYAAYAPGLKTLGDAVQLRNKILGAFEACERTLAPHDHPELLTFVIVGGGPTGVELAGAIAELARQTLETEFRRFDPASLKLILVEAGPRILASFAESLAAAATAKPLKLGGEGRTGAPVEKADAEGVLGRGERIRTSNVFWAAGVRGSPAAKWLGAEADRAGRVKVLADCSVPSHPEIFVVGDTAYLEEGGKPLPGVAQVAIQQGRYVGRLIAGRLKGKPEPRPFKYFNKGNLGTRGRHFGRQGGVRHPHRRPVRQAGVGLRSHSVPGSDEQPTRDAVPVVVETPDPPAACASHHRTGAVAKCHPGDAARRSANQRGGGKVKVGQDRGGDCPMTQIAEKVHVRRRTCYGGKHYVVQRG